MTVIRCARTITLVGHHRAEGNDLIGITWIRATGGAAQASAPITLVSAPVVLASLVPIPVALIANPVALASVPLALVALPVAAIAVALAAVTVVRRATSLVCHCRARGRRREQPEQNGHSKEYPSRRAHDDLRWCAQYAAHV